MKRNRTRSFFWITYALLVEFVLCAGLAHAEPTYWLDTMVASQHFPDRGFNQFNPGIGVEADWTDWQIAVGTYRNSYDRQTNYAMVGFLPVHVGSVSLGVVGGPATGYAFPVIGAFEAAYRAKSWGVNILAVPPVMKGAAVIGLQLVWRLP